jgi:hypothetical protein
MDNIDGVDDPRHTTDSLALPKEWLYAPDGVDCFVEPPFEADEGEVGAELPKGESGLLGKRVRDPENPWGCISIVTRETIPIEPHTPSMLKLDAPRQVQEAYSLKIYKG